jgi:dienelactone hydrolase
MTKKYCRILCGSLALFFFVAAPFVQAGDLSEAEISETRAAFLRLINRPRVAFEAATNQAAISNGLALITFSFQSDSSNRVPGLLIKTAASQGKRPAIIVAHGTGGNKKQQVPLMNELAGMGFAAVAIDGRYHGERTKKSGTQDYNDAIVRAFHDGGEHPFFYDTVWDMMRLIDYLESREDIDSNRIGMIGFSKGGIETYFTAAVDPRIAVAVPCIGVQSFRWALNHNDWKGRINTVKAAFEAITKEAGVTEPDSAFVQKFYDRVVPEIYSRFDGPNMLQLIAPRPLLVVSGDTDDHNPLPGLMECAEMARKSYERRHVPERFKLLLEEKTGHKVTAAAQDAANDWFVQWLKPAGAQPVPRP